MKEEFLLAKNKRSNFCGKFLQKKEDKKGQLIKDI